MNYGPELLLVGAVAAVGILHTMVPDHWVPITLIARQQGWTKAETARASLKAGTGHVLSTLAIAVVVWFGGVAFAQHFGHYVDIAASAALIGFGVWIAASALLEMRGDASHSHHGHHHGVVAAGSIHGSELQTIKTDRGNVFLSIYGEGMLPHFRLTGGGEESFNVETVRDDGSRQSFAMGRQGKYWESVDAIPEPHQFTVSVRADMDGRLQTFEVRFEEDPEHGHQHPIPKRTALLFILGSSPMVEGIPAFRGGQIRHGSDRRYVSRIRPDNNRYLCLAMRIFHSWFAANQPWASGTLWRSVERRFYRSRGRGVLGLAGILTLDPILGMIYVISF
jgi:ABC-type nickel/cobalt efflux system permease component RcnA